MLIRSRATQELLNITLFIYFALVTLKKKEYCDLLRPQIKPMSRKLIHFKRNITILLNGKLSENVSIYKVHFSNLNF